MPESVGKKHLKINMKPAIFQLTVVMSKSTVAPTKTVSLPRLEWIKGTRNYYFKTIGDCSRTKVKSPLKEGFMPGGVLPYMGYIGMCRCEGYGFQAVYSRIGYINQSVWL